MVETTTLAMSKIFVFQDTLPHKKHQKNISQQFLRHILQHCFNITSYDYIQPHQGKPFLKEGPFFNISHSQNKIVLALSFHRPVGIDIEYIKPRPHYHKIMKRFFAHEEQNKVESSDHPLETFYDLWTQKEAFIKLMGGSILSKEFQRHGQFPVQFQKIQMKGYKGHVCYLDT